jgi:hypothetical protein
MIFVYTTIQNSLLVREFSIFSFPGRKGHFEAAEACFIPLHEDP